MVLEINREFIDQWDPRYDETESDEANYQQLMETVVGSQGEISQETFLAIWKWKGALRVKRFLRLDQYATRYLPAIRRSFVSPTEQKLVVLLETEGKLPGMQAPTASTLLHFMHPDTIPI